MSDKKADTNRPTVDKPDEFEQMGTPPVAPAPQAEPTPTPAVNGAEAKPVEAAAPKETPPDEKVAKATPPAPEASQVTGKVAPTSQTTVQAAKPAREKLAEKPEKKPEQPADKKPPVPEKFQMAAAAPAPPPVPVQEIRSTTARPDGGAANSGFTSFEANKHALGEYMLGVRNKVEHEWRTALQIRYAGVSRTHATLTCSIRPDGTLESVRITDAGDSLTYAVLCRQAIEQAAPFGPFPFDVPEIYRSQNLEITWKFSYL